MKSYQIFLASSLNEFKDERNEIGDFIRRIQDILIDYHIRLKLFECEFYDNSVASLRKQEEYNEEIKRSQIFLMLVGKTVGMYTLEEYHVAQSYKVPYIYVLLQKKEHDNSIALLKDNMNKGEICYEFETYFDMKQYIAKMIQRCLKESVEIQVDENKMWIETQYVSF